MHNPPSPGFRLRSSSLRSRFGGVDSSNVASRHDLPSFHYDTASRLLREKEQKASSVGEFACGLMCVKVSYMRETLTISLPKELRRGLEKMARAEGVTSSEYVRRASKADIFRRALRAARRELVPQARARGIYTDEDVFKIVS